MADYSEQEVGILHTFARWMETAREEVDDIGGWRDAAAKRDGVAGDPRREWQPMPQHFHSETIAVAAWLRSCCPGYDPAPILDIYRIIRTWHDDHNASRIPVQAALWTMLEDAVDQLRIVRDGIIKPRLFPTAATPDGSESDDSAWVLVSKLQPPIIENVLERRRYIQKHPEIKSRRPLTKAGTPNQKRLEVHIGDWVKHWDKVDRQTFNSLDSANPAPITPDELTEDFIGGAAGRFATLSAKKKRLL